MRIGVPKEGGGERRVALIPSSIPKLTKAGFEVLVENGAGKESFFPNSEYEKNGAKIATRDEVWHADIILKVGLPTESEIASMKDGAHIIGLLNPFQNIPLMEKFASRNITSFAMELVPRTSRAQSMDALSSQASIGGYKAILLAANKLGQFFPMLTTAAGTITPARVLVIGVGVAGLQAIATARRLGAVVEAFDIRPQTKQEVESLGAKFIEINLEEKTEAGGGYAKEVSEEAKRKEREILAQHVRSSDVVITAAQVQGRKAPVLLTEEMIRGMKEGSVIVDMAAEQGGNCALTQPGKDIVHEGVTIMGPLNIPSMMPVNASQMYARNISTFLLNMTKEGKLVVDVTDDIVKGSLVTKDGKIVNEALKVRS